MSAPGDVHLRRARLRGARYGSSRLRTAGLRRVRGRSILPLALLLLLLVPPLAAGLPKLAAQLPEWPSDPPPPAVAAAPATTGVPALAGVATTTRLIVSVPLTPAALDLVAVLDLTGSYAGTLPNVTRLLPELQRTLAAKSDLRVGLATFMDDPCCGGDSSDYPYRLDLGLTDQADALAKALKGLTAGAGGDPRESWLVAVSRAAKEVGFRPGASHVLLLSTDTDSHHRSDGSGSTGPDVDQVAETLRAAGVRVIALLPRDHDAKQAVELARRSGGTVQFVERSSEDLDDAILAGLESVHVDIEPSVVAGCPVHAPAFDPPRLENVGGGARVPMALTYEVAPDTRAGEHTCTVDLGPAGRQTFTVRVPG